MPTRIIRSRIAAAFASQSAWVVPQLLHQPSVSPYKRHASSPTLGVGDEQRLEDDFRVTIGSSSEPVTHPEELTPRSGLDRLDPVR
jgi:hypothetical protein